MRLLAVIVLLVTTSTGVLAASKVETKEDKAQTACATQALQDYAAQKVALYTKISAQALPLPSVEDILARRRLEESYCAREIQCFVTPTETRGVMFSNCLDAEHDERKQK